MKNQHSMVGRLTFLISIGLLIIWLITISITTYISLNNDRQRVIENLSHISRLRMALSNYRFQGAERDALALAQLYRHYVPADTPLTAKSECRYFPFNAGTGTPQDKQAKDMSFIQIYGTAGQTYYLDSFILDRGYGIYLLPPLHHSPDYLIHRQNELWQFPRRATHHNLFWGKPEYIPGAGWSVSVAAAGSHDILVGLAVKLDDLPSYDHNVSGGSINLWLDKHNQILPFSALTENNSEILQKQLLNVSLHDGWQQIPGYLVLRSELKGPGWQQLILYPTSGMLKHTLNIVAEQLPFALTTLLLLAMMLFWLLHRYLARPLRDFVSIIEKTGPGKLSARLPENRHDELGSIARTYNLLLDALHKQYDSLENTVAERTRELTIAKQLAEQANKRKSSHLTTISHELRTPLSGILGALELLQLTPMSEKQSQLSTTASQCTLSLLSIINNLLDFTRIESGQLSLHIEDTPILPLLDQAMHTIQGPGQSKGLTLKTFVGHRVPLVFGADKIRLRQILVNLLGNALKFTDKGAIYLSVKRIGDFLIFAVSDSGQGITPADQKAVFEPFFQSKGKGHSQGTGLGLTISSTLAKMMGGWLEIRSTPKFGTCISLLLPLGKYQPPEPLAGNIAAPLVLHRQLCAWGLTCEIARQENVFSADDLCFLPGKLRETVVRALSGVVSEDTAPLPVQPWRLHILLVDDAAINRDIFGMMLASLGQQFTLAESGEEALALGRQQRFDLVLMDIRMPETDGMECTQRWRQDALNHDPHCMIIALSANTTPEEISRSKEAGMQHYLTKPVYINQLANAISIAAEYQLERDITLQEQDYSSGHALLPMDDDAMRRKIRHSLHLLLCELEHNLGSLPKTSTLLHTLKGCLGQAGLTPLVCSIIDMENRVQHGLTLAKEEITEFRHILNSALDA
ncbi:two component system sensor kinase [Morganella morganii]|uniref:two component system sensor kinase n=1 Tax=Morganella morganii TaxID=582 RepID=UPI001A30A15B|nr:two component system sensor kinase [Morganella morganii]MCU6211798.1 two component system sensor kinase [Morganella morganii]MCU6225521.1 two component system sensor kinase [Morganella morganii]MCU6232640.1 two component system sensor kinase [Morganella morganii]MCU6237513.1 two component system sensor kinase [Morganella morganii]MCU6274940.1 two component system sensor kinase [Morganella morganii]